MHYPTYDRRLLLSLLASLLFLSGCSTLGNLATSLGGQADNNNAPPPLKAITPSINVQTLWQTNTGFTAGKQQVRLHPYLQGNAIFVAAGQQVGSWNKDNGQAQWRKSMPASISGGINGGQQSLFLGTEAGDAIALDQATGQQRWSKNLGSPVLAASTEAEGRVIFRTLDAKITALSSNSGDILWQKERPAPAFSIRGASVPLIAKNIAVAGLDNGVITTLNLTNGTRFWESILAVPQRGNLGQILDIDGRMKILGSALFATSYNGQLVGIDLSNGQKAWSQPFASRVGVDADVNGLYAINRREQIWKLNPQTGEPLWKQEQLIGRSLTTPTLTGTHIVVGDGQGYLHWLDTANGNIAARVQLDQAGYQVAPLRSGNRIYSFGQGGVLAAHSSGSQ